METPVSISAEHRQQLDQLVHEITKLDAEACTLASQAVARRIEIGRQLIKAKDLLPHGQFEPWVTKQFGWTRQWAAKHMQLAKADGATQQKVMDEAATMTAALTLVSGADDESDANPKDDAAEQAAKGPLKNKFPVLAPAGGQLGLMV
ncbi:MAG TPA: DUF3102 domain-containing protein [Chloroflexota bacterium]|nr:DUF3102 domain-containing protein [Chloroflexota bacterium]